MRNIYLILIILLSIGVGGQKYSFDFLTKYESKSTDSNRPGSHDVVNYFNSDDFNYYLRLFKNKSGFYAYLYDYSKMKWHKFDVKEDYKNGELQFTFDYAGTKQLTWSKSSFKNYRFEFSNVSDKSANLKIYKNQKSTKPLREYTFHLKKANKNLFPMIRIAMMHPYENIEALDITKNVIVEKATDICIEKECNCEMTLTAYKNVELDLEVPSTTKSFLF